MSKSIKAIGFDYFGVVLPKSEATAPKFLADLVGVSVGEWQEAFYEYIHERNTKVVTKGDFYQKLLTKLNKEEYLAHVLEYIEKHMNHEIDSRLIDLIDRLRKNGYKVGLLSNMSTEGAEKMFDMGIANHFDVFLTSQDIGVIKPALAAFEIFAERLEVALDEIVFVDDSEKSLSTAVEVGFHPIYYTDCESLKEDFSLLGIDTK